MIINGWKGGPATFLYGPANNATPIALLHPLSSFQAYDSNHPVSSDHGTLQARIELQREKIRSLELVAEERRKTEQFRNQEQRRPGRRRIEQRWIDGPIREQSVILHHKNAEEALKAANEAIRQTRLAQIEQISELERQRDEQRRKERQAQDEQRRRERQVQDEQRRRERQAQAELERQRDEQRRRERQVQDELGMQALLRHKSDNARDAEYQRLTKLREAEQNRVREDEQRRRDRGKRDEAGRRAIQRHKAALQVQKAQQEPLIEGRIIPFDGVLPSFLDEEYRYKRQASADFPEGIASYNQMRCMKDYQRAISDASRRLPCGLCGGLFQEDEVVSVDLRDDNLQCFLQRTKTAPDRCAVKDDVVSMCTTCNSAIAKRAIPPLSAGNFVNCLFCQDYPDALKNLNTIEEAFIARAHVVGIFLKLTSGAKSGISYRGSRGHSVAVRQDPSELLKILPATKLRDHATITVSWDRGSPPSEENLARFCSVDKAKVVNALLWLCANNPVYKSVVVDYSVLDSWPNHHIPQEIRDAFLTLGSEPGSTDPPVEDEREGYTTLLQNGLFENELDAEVEDAEPGSILSRSFFSDLHGQDLHSTPATLASLQAILQEQDSDRSGPGEDDVVNDQDDKEGAPNDNSRLPHISYKTTQHLPLMSSFTDPDYFTAAFPTLFPFGIGGHLGDANGDRPEEVSLKAFARYTMLHHSLLWVSPTYYHIVLIFIASLNTIPSCFICTIWS